MEATTKVIPVMKLGPRTLDMAMGVVHELCQRMPSGCTPIFSSDGLKLYFYALTAHFGYWALGEGMRKPIWEITAGFLYAQVKKIHRRRKLVKVEHLMLWGEREKMTTGLKALGLSGKINTAFVERLNLTIRQGVAFLVRCTWGAAQFTSELELHLQWWRGLSLRNKLQSLRPLSRVLWGSVLPTNSSQGKGTPMPLPQSHTRHGQPGSHHTAGRYWN